LDIAVVDDERVIREYLCELIEKQRPKSHVKAYATGEELLASGGQFDIVFLDIQMNGMNGIEAARSLRERQEEIVLIFITGLKEYVFDALDLYAFQYLLKPLDEKKFTEVLDRAIKEAGKKKEKRGLFIKAKNLTLDLADILYIESHRKKVAIHTTRDRESIEIYATMEELEGQLGEGFYRCHRAYIVNMAHITEYSNDSILLTNGDKIYLAKKKYREFVKAYMWHLQDGGVSSV